MELPAAAAQSKDASPKVWSPPVDLAHKNWLFAGLLRAGQRAAAVMSLIQSAGLNGHAPQGQP